MSISSSSRAGSIQVRDCLLKWQLQGGNPGSGPLIDLRNGHTRLPLGLDRLVGRVHLLRICITSEFYAKNERQIQSVASKVKLQCFIY